MTRTDWVVWPCVGGGTETVLVTWGTREVACSRGGGVLYAVPCVELVQREDASGRVRRVSLDDEPASRRVALYEALRALAPPGRVSP